MNLIADPESTLRLPLPVLRQQPLPLPSLPVEHRLQDLDEPEETSVSFRRRGSLSDAERDDRHIYGTTSTSFHQQEVNNDLKR